MKSKLTVGIKQCDECEYYLRCEECCYYHYYKKELPKLKQQLAEKDKELEKIKSYNVALFASLYQILEKEDSENVSSRIDQLTAQNNSYTSDLYKCNKGYDRLDKALKSACEYMCKYDVPCPNNKCEQKQCLEDKSFCYYTYFKFKAMEELENE